MVKVIIKKLFGHNKKFIITVIALLEAIIIFSAVTFSWVEGSKNGIVKDNENLTVSAGDGLMFRDLDGKSVSQLLLKDTDLEDCSSVDGRNFFFPTTESSGTLTDNYVFRAGTDSDKNTKYISRDFTVESLSTSNIFIDEQSYVRCDTNTQIRFALRISINFNDGSDPIVLCPGINNNTYAVEHDAVSSIDNYGKAVTTTTKPNAFSSFNFSSHNPIATINGGETKRVTFTMWLEGTDKNCTISNVPKGSLHVNFILSTTENPTRTITFKDYSPNKWIEDKADNNENVAMFAIDKSSFTGDNYIEDGHYYELKLQSDGITYKGEVPESVEDIMFARFDPHEQGKDYNIWANEPNVSMGTSTTYYAIGRGKSVDNGVNYGYWVDDNCTGVIDLYLTEAIKEEIYFTDKFSWNNVYAFFMDKNNYTVGTSFPGTKMTSAGKNYMGESTYKVNIPQNAVKVQFNNGVGINEGGKRTVDITLANYGITKGFYINDTQGENGNDFNVARWTDNRSTGTFSGFVEKGNITTPNLYFKSANYGAKIKYVGDTVKIGGFNPQTAFNKDNNFGLAMEYAGDNSDGQHVYHLIIPADAYEITFNGFNNKWIASTDTIIKSYKFNYAMKKGYWYESSSSHDTWNPDNSWPRR